MSNVSLKILMLKVQFKKNEKIEWGNLYASTSISWFNEMISELKIEIYE